MSNSKPLEPYGVLFLDRTHQSNIAIKLLNALGCSVERHKTHFLPDAPDDEWIPVCAQNGWIIISGDKGIIRDGINRAAVQESRAKVFILADTDGRGADWAASLALAARKILELSQASNGPFHCQIKRAKDAHVGRVEYLPGGSPVDPSPEQLSTPVATSATEAATETGQSESDIQPKIPFDN